MSKKKTSTTSSTPLVQNKKAFHDYHIEQRYEAGLVLKGWEVKSLRAGRGQLKDSHVHIKNGEAWLIAAHISPLPTAATYTNPDPSRSRKLLLNKKELQTLIGAVQRKGYTIVPLSLYWKRNIAKLEIGLAKGKKQYDKRADLKEREWQREKERALKKR